MGIKNNLVTIEGMITGAARRAGRDPGQIKLVAVSKTVSLDRICEAVRGGVRILGENRVQEARGKIAELGRRSPGTPPAAGETDREVQWHLIGNLQRNKARDAVRLFDLIHTVDSSALAEDLAKQARSIGKVQRVLVQIKLSAESAKHGVSEQDLTNLLASVTSAENLSLEGLMTMPPLFDDIEKTRPYFRRLRQIAERARAEGFPVSELSMGMSRDFTVAIEEGATMVRVGSAIFGERNV